ncbi:hypothetical protein [Kutzneria sp. CA-103260]|uniref:hypothetical protein n=1 Tax=Kutzneria sp. CA-103260 TaxID=2802641 RepID=UPI001BAC44F4|nr:hypothetical protein [Kutzneria sp. CA-103260]QUQ68323.1 hypothetical protein JJ691_60680 [Kutzneria sp. CA-103260]
MRSSVAKRTAAASAAVGLALVGLAVVPAVASAAPAAGGAQLCVDRFADYSAVMQWPNRGGMETTVTGPGQCSNWGPGDAGELIVVLAFYNGAQINLGHFQASGRGDNVEAVGRVSDGTEGINLGV